MNYIAEKRTPIGVALVVVLGICTVALFHFPSWGDVPMLVGPSAGTRDVRTVRCSLTSNLGADSVLEMDLAIPYADYRQRNDLLRKMPRIKSDFFTLIDQVEMARWIRERNYDVLKNELLAIINRHSAARVDIFYFESFQW